ncbi:hypothetical protein E4T43_00375 [Aureobasidium subglaciale]|nr:hypothetical protein E4T43_00375 [Aureobasidium subglaciale]
MITCACVLFGTSSGIVRPDLRFMEDDQRSLHFSKTPLTSEEHLNQLKDVINFTVLLPGYGVELYRLIESAEDRQQNDAVLTESLRSLTQALRCWHVDSADDGKGSSRAGGIKFVLRAHSKSAIGNMEDLTEKRKQLESEGGDDIGATRFQSSYLHLGG